MGVVNGAQTAAWEQDSGTKMGCQLKDGNMETRLRVSGSRVRGCGSMAQEHEDVVLMVGGGSTWLGRKMYRSSNMGSANHLREAGSGQGELRVSRVGTSRVQHG